MVQHFTLGAQDKVFCFVPFRYSKSAALIFLLCSCLPGTRNSPDAWLYIDNTEAKDYFVEQLFSEYEIIELKHLIGKVDEVIRFNDHWLVLDKMQESIKIFDKRGRHVTTVKGDLLNNGISVQPVCMAIYKPDRLIFYDAGNESLVLLNQDYQLVAVQEAKFYIHKIYPFKEGFVVYKNQTEHNNEEDEYHYDLMLCDRNFVPVKKFRSFKILLNEPRTWLHFADPVSIMDDNIWFFSPLADSVWGYNLKTQHTTIKKIRFAKDGIESKALGRVDILNPREVMEEVFGRYSLISSKLYANKLATGIRYVNKAKQQFSFSARGVEKTMQIKNLKLRYDGKDVIVPFPSYFLDTSLVSVLDSDNYEELNLTENNLEHVLIKNIIYQGKTYLLVFKSLRDEIS